MVSSRCAESVSDAEWCSISDTNFVALSESCTLTISVANAHPADTYTG